MNGYLDALKGKPAKFTGDGFECMLRPLTFGEKQEVRRFIAENTDKPGFSDELERKLVTLGLVDPLGGQIPDLDCSDLAAPITEAIAREVGYRNGLLLRPDEKKALPSSTSIPQATTSGATTQSPPG